MRRLIILAFVIAPGILFAQHSMDMSAGAGKTGLVPGLGGIHHPVSTKNPQAQRFFDQGLEFIYAFNHDEAVKSFKRAAEIDPNLAMAYWGIALARGSNYNWNADSEQLKEAFESLQKALAHAPKTSERDRAFIDALSKRYSSDPAADQAKLAVAYKEAMGGLVKRFPDDLDAATLYAESMMNLRPWQLWSLDGKPAENTLEIVSVLESVLKRNSRHTGANHYYIHAVEASPNPERALPSAARLATLAPAAGHLVHMPSHIYIRTGDYEAVNRSNTAAAAVDEKYIKNSGGPSFYSNMYYNHNVHFLASVNAMMGRYAESIHRARQLQSNVSQFIATMPMLETFAIYPMVTMVRFHKWADIKNEPEPSSPLKIMRAYRHFARGVAFAETGDPQSAEAERALLRVAVKAIAVDVPMGLNTPADYFAVADQMLAGEIALSRKEYGSAIDLLTQASSSVAKLNYDEPSDWDLPIAEWLGRAQMMDARYEDAEKTYRDELVRHPRNGRALFGLAEALKKQKKNTEAAKVQFEFRRAWRGSDTTLVSRELP